MKTNERYKIDIEAMINLANGTLMSSDKDYLDKIMHKIRTNDDLISVTASTGALPTGLQNMIHYENQGSKSWMNGKIKFGHQNQNSKAITSFQRTSLVMKWKTENQRSTECTFQNCSISKFQTNHPRSIFQK